MRIGRLTLAFGLAACAAILTLLPWSDSAPLQQPALTQAPSPATPEASTGVLTAHGESSATPQRARTTLQISGTVPRGVDTVVLSIPGAPLQSHYAAQQQRFAFTVVAPCTEIVFHLVLHGGRQWQTPVSRPPELAHTDWEVGLLRVANREATVNLVVEYDPRCVQSLRGCGQEVLGVSILQTAVNGALIGATAFALQELDSEPKRVERSIPVSVPSVDTPLVVVWQMQCDRVNGRVATMRIVDVVAVGSGNTCSSRLVLAGSTTIRGRVEDRDQRPRVGESVVYSSDRVDGVKGAEVVTDADGGFCFLVGDADTGTLCVSPRGQLATGVPRELRAGSGAFVRVVAEEDIIRFRLVDESGRPIEHYRVSSGLPRRRKSGDGFHADGVASELADVLRNRRWLQFTPEGDATRTFPVPASWFGSPETMHTVSVRDFTPVGSLEIVPPRGSVVHDLRLEMRGTDEIDGLFVSTAGPGAGTWRVDVVTAGTYQYECLSWKGGSRAKGVVVITPGAITTLALPE